MPFVQILNFNFNFNFKSATKLLHRIVPDFKKSIFTFQCQLLPCLLPYVYLLMFKFAFPFRKRFSHFVHKHLQKPPFQS